MDVTRRVKGYLGDLGGGSNHHQDHAYLRAEVRPRVVNGLGVREVKELDFLTQDALVHPVGAVPLPRSLPRSRRPVRRDTPVPFMIQWVQEAWPMKLETVFALTILAAHLAHMYHRKWCGC